MALLSRSSNSAPLTAVSRSERLTAVKILSALTHAELRATFTPPPDTGNGNPNFTIGSSRSY